MRYREAPFVLLGILPLLVILFEKSVRERTDTGTTRLVEVPISVHIPPSMVAYERGIKNLVAGMRTDSAQRLIIGAKITTTGVLLRKAETKEIAGSIRACAFMTVVFS